MIPPKWSPKQQYHPEGGRMTAPAKERRTKQRACPACTGYVDDHCDGKYCRWFICTNPECKAYGVDSDKWTFPQKDPK